MLPESYGSPASLFFPLLLSSIDEVDLAGFFFAFYAGFCVILHSLTIKMTVSAVLSIGTVYYFLVFYKKKFKAFLEF